jgi:hypothetical protein
MEDLWLYGYESDMIFSGSVNGQQSSSFDVSLKPNRAFFLGL